MILRQFLHTNPVAVSYLFGCGGKAAGAEVDPVGEIEPYLRAAQDTGMRILYVIDTHIHADHLSAGQELARAAGAPYVLFAGADAVCTGTPTSGCVQLNSSGQPNCDVTQRSTTVTGKPEDKLVPQCDANRGTVVVLRGNDWRLKRRVG